MGSHFSESVRPRSPLLRRGSPPASCQQPGGAARTATKRRTCLSLDSACGQAAITCANTCAWRSASATVGGQSSQRLSLSGATLELRSFCSSRPTMAQRPATCTRFRRRTFRDLIPLFRPWHGYLTRSQRPVNSHRCLCEFNRHTVPVSSPKKPFPVRPLHPRAAHPARGRRPQPGRDLPVTVRSAAPGRIPCRAGSPARCTISTTLSRTVMKQPDNASAVPEARRAVSFATRSGDTSAPPLWQCAQQRGGWQRRPPLGLYRAPHACREACM
jgi:hypothetical protein